MYSQGVDERELPARRPGGRRGRHRHVHRASSRPATRAAGRTSTSRSTRASTKATDPANKIATSQIALPEDACRPVYATAGYEQSVSTLSQVSLASDNVFGDDGGDPRARHDLGKHLEWPDGRARCTRSHRLAARRRRVAGQSLAARSSSRSRSGRFSVRAAARRSSVRASSRRPTLASRSPRTAGRRW